MIGFCVLEIMSWNLFESITELFHNLILYNKMTGLHKIMEPCHKDMFDC